MGMRTRLTFIIIILLGAAWVCSSQTTGIGNSIPSALSLSPTKRGSNISFVPEQNYSSDFNFHNKTLFLKAEIWKLVECIEETIKKNPDRPLPYPETLKKVKKGRKEQFVFKYIGSRGFNETCLGDAYKRDFIRRLYDAACIGYKEKVAYLDSFSCNASQNLECRLVGKEEKREFAEQATPIMRCLCPNYNTQKPQIFYPIDEDENNRNNSIHGYFDRELQSCVLKVGQKCAIPKKLPGLDRRFSWNDFDMDENGDGEREGIDVVDMRPLPATYPCVKNAFCYVQDSMGLVVESYQMGRCICRHRHFQTEDNRCELNEEEPNLTGVGIALALMTLSGISFFSGLLEY